MTKVIFCLFILGISVFSCKTTPKVPEHDCFEITSKFVKENRIITVWTPPIYEHSSDNLPVLFMPDGGIKEDFPHVAITLDKLIEENKIPPLILVGIENTERARDLTGLSTVKEHEKYDVPMTDGAKYFRAFITEELIPEISNRYRTTGKKGIIGKSLGGLFVIETLFLQPESFDFYIAIDPSFWWNNNYLVNNADQFLDKLPQKQIKLWFAGSSEESVFEYTNQLADILKSKPPKNLKWKYSPEPEEEHQTIFRATKEKALIWIMNESQ